MRVSPLFMPSLTSLTPLWIVTISLTVSLTMLRQAPESWWSCFWICAPKDVPQERRISFELVDCVKKIYLHQLGRPSSNLVRTQMEEKKRIRNKDGFSSWRKRFSFFFLQTTKCLVLRLPVLRIYTSHFPFHPYFQSLEKLNIIPRIYWIFFIPRKSSAPRPKPWQTQDEMGSWFRSRHRKPKIRRAPEPSCPWKMPLCCCKCRIPTFLVDAALEKIAVLLTLHPASFSGFLTNY